ncbi:O-antigen ligase family protein [Herbiconiux daphne]|uniref:O-antigen ligase family protein n=1 Tax=Herbiconiux daphne TaxID=2970914 RepID=A0ABT2H6Q2_9MICO|nr:O-antigen ligase family protein [Herbiconiux daphne]MCS5735599.1 O-antigen ligase family protein [Herbiconiux daphne]
MADVTTPQRERAHRPARDRGPRVLTTIAIAIVVTAVVVVAVLFLEPLIVGGVLLVVCGLYVFRRAVFNWTTMLFVLTAVILFIPIRRYALPIPVGFALEPYRVTIAALLVALGVHLFVRGRKDWKPVVWGWPIAIFLWTAFASLMVNAVAITETGLVTAGFANIFQLAFLLSTIVIFRQMLSSEAITTILLNVIVFGGAFIGISAFLERVTHRNIFLMLNQFLPLEILRDDAESLRAGGARAFGSAQHPIALAVLFCMIIPLAIYLMKFSPWPKFQFTRILVYSAAIGLMMIGLLSAVSRTGIVALGVMFLFILLVRPKLAGLLAVVGLPVVIVVGLIFPALFESTVLSLFDLQGLVASQTTSVGLAGQGRLADLPEAFAQFGQNPLAGTGLGSRIVVGPEANSQILDNQWLGSLLETGIIGVLGLIALLVWPIVVMVRFSFRRGVPEQRAMLVLAVTTSAIGYATSMFFYDAFAFMQTLLLLSLLLAIGAWAMTFQSESWGGVYGLAKPRARERALVRS